MRLLSNKLLCRSVSPIDRPEGLALILPSPSRKYPSQYELPLPVADRRELLAHRQQASYIGTCFRASRGP